MFLGHFAVADIVRQTVARSKGSWLLVPAAYGPDLVDKPLRVLFDLQGRGAGHTLLFFVALLVPVALTWRWMGRKTRILAALGASMWLFHLVFDLTDPVILFWPLLGDLPQPHHLGFLELLVHYSEFYLKPTFSALLVLDLLCLTAMAAVRASGPLKRAVSGLLETGK